jgi:WD40 repeat protein
MDTTARLWDAKTGREIAVLGIEARVLTRTSKMVWDAEFSPDARHVVTVSYDNAARLWSIFPTTQALIDDAKKVVPRCLEPDERKEVFLEPDPLPWCIEMQKWPYEASKP